MTLQTCSNFKKLFEMPEGVIWLNCAYLSPQLKKVGEAGVAAVHRRARPWEIWPEDWFREPEKLRGLFARLVGGDANQVALIPSVSYGVAIAAANIPMRAGQTIVVLEEQFPSNYYGWREIAKERGLELVVVPRPADADWTAAVIERITAATAVAALLNCHWTDGTLVDLAKVGVRVREVGAALVVDATQSLGALPLGVKCIGADFLIAAGYKWLLGPYGLAYMHVSDRFLHGRPIEHNWVNRARSENFAKLTSYTDDYQPGARRFDVGERSFITLVPMALAALTQILEWGVEAVQAGIRVLTDEIAARAEEIGFQVAPRAHRAGHMIGLRSPKGLPEDLVARLAAQHVHVSVRGSSIRVSPHLYNSKEDVARLFEVLRNVLHA